MASRKLSLTLYNALLPLGLLLMAPAAFLKMRRRGGQWRDFGQRFGFWGAERQRALESLPRRDLIWMHAVSVGEVGVAKKLIEELLRQHSGQAVVLTTTTPTGYRLARELELAHVGRVVALYSPLDLPFVARRVLRELHPVQLVLVEAEVWPNFVAEAQRRAIPVTLVNARLSSRSERRYHRILGLVSPVFGMLSRVLVQEPEDVARWSALGVARKCIEVVGSVKYDPQGAEPGEDSVKQMAALLQLAGLQGRSLLLAASTHAGEELELARIYQRLALKHPGLGLLLVPRHYERGRQVQTELLGLGLQAVLRSGLAQPQATNVLIVDSTGELKAWQQLADLVIVGKSFLAEGGQNPAEAVLARKPVVFGPHMENFLPLVKLLLDAQGAAQVAGLEELEACLDRLLAEPAKGARMAEAGRQALMRHQGATTRTASRLLQVGSAGKKSL